MKPVARLALIGVGLIGGSLVRALREAGMVGKVVGCGRGLENLQRALKLGVIDRIEQDPARAVAGADLVVVAVPMGAMEDIFRAIAPALAPEAVVTDVGSSKVLVVEAAHRVWGRVPPFLVPGHPIAGTEKTGVDASFAGLFRDRRVILTPQPETDPEALKWVTALWSCTGAQVQQMSTEHHDRVLAATSHLPHVLAYTLVDVLSTLEERHEVFRYAAGGFRDFSRIASSDPAMWRDICLANRDALLEVLDHFNEDLAQVRRVIADSDGAALLEVFQRAKSARDRFVE